MTFISTAGHGFLQITHNQLKQAMQKGFEPTTCSFINQRNVLLEEDCDATSFMKIFFKDDYKEKWQAMQSKSQDDINRNLLSVIPTTIEEYETYKNKIINYYNLVLNTVIMSYNDEKFYATGKYQKNKAIVKDIYGTILTLSFNNVKEIQVA